MQPSKGSLDRYYSVASVFKCEHFKSMDTRLSNHNTESSDECSNNSHVSTTIFCHSSCFCSAASHAASGTIAATTSESTSTENPASSYSQLDTSTSNESSSDTTEGSDESGANHDMVDESRVSADTIFESSESRVGDTYDDGRIEPASSSESRIASDVTVTLDGSSEEFFTDAATIDFEDELDDDHRKHTVVHESVDSLVKRSSSTSELMATTHCRYGIHYNYSFSG